MEAVVPTDERTTLGARVTSQILALIGEGALEAGQRLVEPVLARRLGVGTVPVREALRILAGDGVIEIIPHKGATLRLMSPKEIGDTLKGIVGTITEIAYGTQKRRRLQPQRA